MIRDALKKLRKSRDQLIIVTPAKLVSSGRPFSLFSYLYS
jgi:hypothetical protein